MNQEVPLVTLRDGNRLPQLGFGTWQVPSVDCVGVLGDAIRAGYRSFDTAQAYGNEEGVGAALRASGLSRDEFFVTSKLRNGAHERHLALRSFDDSMKRLGLEELDLFLIHWPVPRQDRYIEAWQVLIELQQAGRVRSIGVSNFDRPHIDRLIRETGVTPAVNQIEMHPLFQQREKRGYHQRRDIKLQSWSPLGPGTASTAWWWTYGRSTAGSLFDDPTIASIANKHGKTKAQVIIRWHLDDGLMLSPKSTRPDRIAENFAVFDFKLDAEDRYRIEAMDKPEGQIGVEPAEWNLIF